MHRLDGAGHGVEAGGEHDHVDVEAALAGRDAGGRDLCDRLLPQVYQRDVGPVVGGVVVGIEAGTLGTERMVVRGQRFGRLRILDDVADLLADQVGEQRVATEVDALVGPELGQDVDEIAGGPGLLEPLAPFGVAQLPAHCRLLRIGDARERPARLLAVAGAVAFQQAAAVRRRSTIVGGQGEVRRALENGELRRLFREQRDRLDPR